MKKYGYGVDIGGTTCKIGLFDHTGVILDKWEIRTNRENHGASVLDDIKASIEADLQKKGISMEEVQGVGVDVPGAMTKDGTVVQCANLGWPRFNVAEAFSKKIGLPVKAANDANVAALGEMWQGGGKGYKNVVMVTLGTGVGGGIIIDGQILSGTHGAGGEIGHMRVNRQETESCGCGKCGCLEQYASATGIVRMAKKALGESDRPSALRKIGDVTAKDIFDAAKAGDELAMEQVKQLAVMLGNALSHIAVVVDPEIFVIGGGVSKAGQMLIDMIQEEFEKQVFSTCESTKFALASLGNDAGMYGCAKMIFEE